MGIQHFRLIAIYLRYPTYPNLSYIADYYKKIFSLNSRTKSLVSIELSQEVNESPFS